MMGGINVYPSDRLERSDGFGFVVTFFTSVEPRRSVALQIKITIKPDYKPKIL
ncbi:MAG: hypothetical protein U9Q83_01615 [Bacteroidota bacterium]|nr:hypothetical protein [Bacteroidota bacterium]